MSLIAVLSVVALVFVGHNCQFNSSTASTVGSAQQTHNHSTDGLFGNDTNSTVPPTQPINEIITNLSDNPKDGSNEGTSDEKKDPLLLLILILIACLLLIVITIIWIVIIFKCTAKPKKSDKNDKNDKMEGSEKVTKRSITHEAITEGPLDPRYGKLDSELNLSLRIANPSVPNLEKQMDNKPHSSV